MTKRTVPRNLKQLRDAFEKTGSWGMTAVQALCFIADEVVKMRKEIRGLREDVKLLQRKPRKQKPSAFNIFIGKKMKKGLSMREAVKEWQRKELKAAKRRG